MRLLDKSKEPFPFIFRPFQGQGKVLSGVESKPNPSGGYTPGSAAPQPVRSRYASINDGPVGGQDAAKLLDKLPQVSTERGASPWQACASDPRLRNRVDSAAAATQAVIRNGKVIPVRDEVAAMLHPPKSDLEVPVLPESQRLPAMHGASRPERACNRRNRPGTQSRAVRAPRAPIREGPLPSRRCPPRR